MNKFLKICGILALTIVCLGGVGIGFLAHHGSELDGESRAYVETAIPAIAASWDRDQLMDRASPALKTMATPEQLASLFETGARLGAIVSFEQPQGQSMSYYGSTTAETAAYATKAKFQNGEAMLRLALVKADGRWMINGFRVQPLTKLTASRA